MFLSFYCFALLGLPQLFHLFLYALPYLVLVRYSIFFVLITLVQYTISLNCFGLGCRLLNNFSIFLFLLALGRVGKVQNFLSLLQLVSNSILLICFMRNNFWLHFILSFWLLLPLSLIFYLSFLSSLNLEIFSIFFWLVLILK